MRGYVVMIKTGTYMRGYVVMIKTDTYIRGYVVMIKTGTHMRSANQTSGDRLGLLVPPALTLQ